MSMYVVGGARLETSCLFTIGYEGLSIDAYLNRLITNQVAMLVDVRKNPISMKYGFSKMQLVNATAKAGISYIHIPDLGIPSRLRQNLKSVSAYQELFEYYFTPEFYQHTKRLWIY